MEMDLLSLCLIIILLSYHSYRSEGDSRGDTSPARQTAGNISSSTEYCIET